MIKIKASLGDVSAECDVNIASDLEATYGAEFVESCALVEIIRRAQARIRMLIKANVSMADITAQMAGWDPTTSAPRSARASVNNLVNELIALDPAALQARLQELASKVAGK